MPDRYAALGSAALARQHRFLASPALWMALLDIYARIPSCHRHTHSIKTAFAEKIAVFVFNVIVSVIIFAATPAALHALQARCRRSSALFLMCIRRQRANSSTATRTAVATGSRSPLDWHDILPLHEGHDWISSDAPQAPDVDLVQGTGIQLSDGRIKRNAITADLQAGAFLGGRAALWKRDACFPAYMAERLRIPPTAERVAPAP